MSDDGVESLRQSACTQPKLPIILTVWVHGGGGRRQGHLVTPSTHTMQIKLAEGGVTPPVKSLGGIRGM
jgi:hypothetical protein